MRQTVYIALCLLFILLVVYPVSAEIKVYDANNQYLGLLVTMTYRSVSVFIPSLEAFIVFSFPGGGGDLMAYDLPIALSYESDDCSGIAYTSPHIGNHIYLVENNYFIVDSTGTKSIIVKSSKNSGGVCHQLTPFPYLYRMFQ